MKQHDQTALGSWHSPADLACASLAVVLGLAVGWIDLHTTEVIVTIAGLLGVGLLLGLLRPASAWRWAVLEVLGLPLMEGAAVLTRFPTAEPVQFDIRIVIVALAFALLGTYGGVFIRRMQRGNSRPSP